MPASVPATSPSPAAARRAAATGRAAARGAPSASGSSPSERRQARAARCHAGESRRRSPRGRPAACSARWVSAPARDGGAGGGHRVGVHRDRQATVASRPDRRAELGAAEPGVPQPGPRRGFPSAEHQFDPVRAGSGLGVHRAAGRLRVADGAAEEVQVPARRGEDASRATAGDRSAQAAASAREHHAQARTATGSRSPGQAPTPGHGGGVKPARDSSAHRPACAPVPAQGSRR